MESYFRSWLFEKRHFIVPYTSNLVLDAVILGAIFIFFGSSGIDSLAYGWLIASVALFAYNFVFAVIVVRPSVKIDFHWSWGGKILKLMAAVSLIELISMSFPVVDRFVAARTLGPGQISALRYAMTLVAIPVLVFIVSFGTASFPWISDYSIQSETDKLKKLYRESIGLIIFVMTLISFGVAIFSGDIIRVAFNRGAFNETSILLTSSPLTIYALGIVFYSIYIFQMRFYFAKMDLFRLGTLLGIMLMIKIAASYLLVGPLGHNGLALSTSITWLVGFGLMTYDLGRKLNIAFADLINYSIIRQVSIAAMIGVYWFIMARFWSGIGQSFVTGLLFLASMAISGILLYLVSSALAKSPELSRISKYIPGRLKPTRWLK
jgi:putative peptidoglycan lipid II flippase